MHGMMHALSAMPAIRRSSMFGVKRFFLSGKNPKPKSGFFSFRRVLIASGIGGGGIILLAALPPGEGLPDSPFERMKTRFSAMYRGSLAFGACGLVMADYKYSLRGLTRGTEEYREALSSCHR